MIPRPPELSYLEPAPAGALAFSLEQLMVGGVLLQAGSGSGKSTAIRQMLEETHSRVIQFVFDSEGEFASLRERFDYIYAAPHGGEAVATPKTARLLCRRLVEVGTSAVLDIYELKLEEKREFIRLFLEELMSLPRTLWKHILIVIDEADLFATQNGEASSTEAIVDVNGRGRKRGYRLVLTTRRLSKIHKDAADLQNRMIGRTGLDVDVKRAGDELGMDKETRQLLTRLAPGTFYVFGPAVSATPVLARTGTITTTHPEAGRIGAVTPPARAKIRALLAQFADLPGEAEEEARTLADVTRQRDEARRELAQVKKAAPVAQQDPGAITKAVEQARSGWTRDLKRIVAKDLGALFKSIDAVVASSGRLAVQCTDLQAAGLALDTDLDGSSSAAAQAPAKEIIYPPIEVRPNLRVTAPIENTPGISRPQQRMLNALASLAALGLEPAPRNVVAALSDQSPRSSGWDKNLSTLRTAGRIAYPDSDHMVLTDAGRAIAHADATITSLADLHAAWKALVSGPQWRMCQALIGVYPDAMDRGALAAESGQSLHSSGWDKNLSTLRTLGLIAYPSSAEAVATRLLMPEGLR